MKKPVTKKQIKKNLEQSKKSKFKFIEIGENDNN